MNPWGWCGRQAHLYASGLQRASGESRQPSARKGNKISCFRCSLRILERCLKYWIIESHVSIFTYCTCQSTMSCISWFYLMLQVLRMHSENGRNKTFAEIHGTTVEPFVCISWNIEIKARAALLSFARKHKADPTKITNTQQIDGALPTIKKAGWWKFASVHGWVVWLFGLCFGSGLGEGCPVRCVGIPPWPTWWKSRGSFEAGILRLKPPTCHLVCLYLSLLIGLAPYIALWLFEESIRQHARSSVYTCLYYMITLHLHNIL